MSRLAADQSGFNLGRSVEITREEVKFYKFIERIRHQFVKMFSDFLRVQLILKGVVTENDWHELKKDIIFVFNSDNYFWDRKEAEVLVKDLYAKGYKNIYISGHSEGGRTATTWVLPVKGVIVHGQDCSIPGFWNIQRNQKTIVLLSKNDVWLTTHRNMIGCRHFFNRDWVTEIMTDDASHAPFGNDTHINEFRKWLQ